MDPRDRDDGVISLVSLNAEGDRHWERILPFLREQKADVVCMQEVFERDFIRLRELFGMEGRFVPTTMALPTRSPAISHRGNCILSKHTIELSEISYYCGDPSKGIPELRVKDEQPVRGSNLGILLIAAFFTGSQRFVVGTTHFTWSKDGMATDGQRRDADALLEALELVPDLVWCGDLNAPRGGEIFSKFAARYRDNIPPQYTTSIDGSLHRAGPLDYVVDGLFSSPTYEVRDVELVAGLSDHCAITARIRRASE